MPAKAGIRETGSAKAQWAFARSNAREAGRSLKLAAFAAFAGPLDLLTPPAPQLTDSRLRGN